MARAPDQRAGRSARSWRAVFKRTVREFREDNITDWAAALTYYGVMSLFPMVLVLVALLGLAGQYPQTSDAVLRIIGKIGPSSAIDTFRKPIEGVVRSKGGAGALLGVGILVSLWSASGYVGAFMRASNAIYGVDEGRPIWKTIPTRLLTTVVLMVMLAVLVVGVTFTGGLAKQVGHLLGIGGTAITVWNIAKWPVIAFVVINMFAILYWAAPNVKHPRFRWISPGGILGLVIWL